MKNKTICLENKNSIRVDPVNPAVFRIRLSEDGKFKESGLNRYDKKIEFRISSRKGSYGNMPKHRAHDIVIHLESKPEKVEVDAEWNYDSQQKTLRICNIAATSKGISVLCKLQPAC